MVRRLQTFEQSQAEVVYETIVAMLPPGDLCEQVYVPWLVRKLGLEDRPQILWDTLRDLASNRLIELHFSTSDLSPADEALCMPGPQIGAVSRRAAQNVDIPEGEGCEVDVPKPGLAVERMPLAYIRLFPPADSAPCGLIGCVRFAQEAWTPPPLKKGPDLGWYDIIALNTSGGKDSQALLDAMMREACRLGVQDRVVAYHADLGEVEWPGNKDLVRRQVAAYGIPLRVVKHRLSLLERVLEKGEWPSNLGTNTQYCTSELKRGVINTLFTADAEVIRKHLPWNPPDSEHKHKWQRPVRILNCTGVRSEESPARSKAAEKKAFLVGSINHGHNGTTKHVDYYMPIAWWTRRQVWEAIRHSGVPHHFAYDIGMPRLSCVLCVLGNKDALLIAGQYNPELLDKYVEVERTLKSMHPTVCGSDYELRPMCVADEVVLHVYAKKNKLRRAEHADLAEFGPDGKRNKRRARKVFRLSIVDGRLVKESFGPDKASKTSAQWYVADKTNSADEGDPDDLHVLQAPENGNCPLQSSLQDVCFPTAEGMDRYERSMARWQASGKNAPKNKPQKPAVKLARKRAWQFMSNMGIEQVREMVEAGVEPGEPEIGSSGT